eukprot:TRINITY_DN56625_c0_g1_i1.p1 TRINITY_DN56625_c0_g1~~TRINITY_DN56625_c0_g1_i1.p1  ORF type:complete len:208 (+),score=79.71 TRINITY_DN56625_c0_g1_i1:74-625(+)
MRAPLLQLVLFAAAAADSDVPEDISDWSKAKVGQFIDDLNLPGLEGKHFITQNVAGHVFRSIVSMLKAHAEGRGESSAAATLEALHVPRRHISALEKAVNAEVVRISDAQWRAKRAKQSDGGGAWEGGIPDDTEIQRMNVVTLKKFLQSQGIDPSKAGAEKSELRRRALEAAAQARQQAGAEL